MPETDPGDETRARPSRADHDPLTSTSTGAGGTEDSFARPADPLPKRIGQFEIKLLLGEGAFGRVYLGFDPDLMRQVAIKVPRPEGLAPEFRDAFLREARATVIIHHPNVCPVYEVGVDGDLPYVVTRYVAGGTLAGLLKRLANPMPPRNAVAIARKLALGLAAAHGQKVIHRDLKPANVLYDEANREVLITGFDPPRVGDQADVTPTGAVFGTPAYMSPEQVRGRLVGSHSDVYSLGVMLYEMVTGRTPFSGGIWEVLRDICETPPRPPSVVRPGLDVRLDALCLKALAKDPADRYPSAKEFADALADYLRGGERNAGPVAAMAEEVVMEEKITPPPLPSARASARTLPPAPSPASRSLPKSPPASGAFESVRISPAPPDPVPGRATAEVPRPITDRVHFSVTAPATVRSGQRYALNVWAHLAAQRVEVIARAERAHPSGPVQIHTKSGVRVARGTGLTVRLRIPAFQPAAPDDTDVIEWNGEIGNATFPVRVPPGTSPGSYDGTVLIYAAGVQIAKLHFDLQVALAEASVGPLAAREVRHKRAFASYASQDRDAVLARIQGIQKVLPELEVFLDVASLRSGEKWADRLEREVASRDVFYLFWSASASTSEWVEREWRAALRVRGIDYIDPVPLVDPKIVPPPPELASAHFNDWVLAYMRGAGAGEVSAGAGRISRWVLVAVLAALIGASMGAGALLALLRQGN